MSEEVSIVILTTLFYLAILLPFSKKVIEHFKSLKFQITVSESSNNVLRQENLILKQKLRKLERRMEYANICNDNCDSVCNNNSNMHN